MHVLRANWDKRRRGGGRTRWGIGGDERLDDAAALLRWACTGEGAAVVQVAEAVEVEITERERLLLVWLTEVVLVWACLRRRAGCRGWERWAHGVNDAALVLTRACDRARATVVQVAKAVDVKVAECVRLLLVSWAECVLSRASVPRRCRIRLHGSLCVRTWTSLSGRNWTSLSRRRGSLSGYEHTTLARSGQLAILAPPRAIAHKVCAPGGAGRIAEYSGDRCPSCAAAPEQDDGARPHDGHGHAQSPPPCCGSAAAAGSARRFDSVHGADSKVLV